MSQFLVSSLKAEERNLVPNQKVAAEIAEAVLVPIYGKDVRKQRPFKVTESEDYWVVDGVIHSAQNEVAVGGAAHIEIRKTDGQMRNVSHGK